MALNLSIPILHNPLFILCSRIIQSSFGVFDELSQQSCKVANRVALTMVFAEASNNRAQAQLMVDQALTASCELLDRIDPVQLRHWFERFADLYSAAGHSSLLEDQVVWSAFLGAHCDLLQRVGLHQKTIASLGDELAAWNRLPVSMEEFGGALDELACLMTDHSEALGVAIQRQAGAESTQKRRAMVFSHAVCGIAIVLVAINEASDKAESREAACATFATFGAGLVKQSVGRLYEVCNLVSV